VHWGTFPLALEDDVEPALELGRARDAAGVPSSAFYTAELGEKLTIAADVVNGGTDLCEANPEVYARFLQLPVHADDRDILKWPFQLAAAPAEAEAEAEAGAEAEAEAEAETEAEGK
jgi:hypothetical protein